MEVQRIIDDAEAGGFDDMEIVSWIAHGYPGPALERQVVIGAPHVGALRLVEAFHKSADKDRSRGWVRSGGTLPFIWPTRSDPRT